MTHPVGYRIGGRYEVKQVLTPGGQGEVYVVFDHNEHATGVLKLIDTSLLPLGAGPWDEARVLNHLADDHILRILNADSIAGQPFIVTALAQYGTPAEVLAEPADEFVARFVGVDRGLKLLSLRRLDELELRPPDGAAGPRLEGTTTLRDALAQMLAEHATQAVVVDGDGRPTGAVALEDLAAARP